LTFCKEYFVSSAEIPDAIASTSGALTGMIPSGMYLLITVGLSVGVIKLGRKKTLVKNLYSIEMLARANVLCLDKTGTITDGTMKVVEVVPQSETKPQHIEEVMKVILENQKTTNATSIALIEKFGKNLEAQVKSVVEFSSQRKYSVTTFLNGKTYYIGAPGFIKCKISAQQRKLMESYMEQGYRVIALVEDASAYNEKTAGKNGKIIAFFILEDHIRKDAIETIAWFKENNVDIKIISGDDALTVSKIAKRVGVENSDKYVSLENMSLQEVAQIANKFTVFGRVTPEQKHVIVKTLKTQGNVVAMTGDGVNDTLALKEANCSIAMADGSEVARNISHLVLLESNFSALPAIVKEGRQIVNNVQHSSVLYLMKTIFTILLCATTLILRISYPFTPKQLLLLEMFVIGLPSFILTFQPNNKLIKGNFIPQVLKKSIPCAIIMFVNVLILLILNANTNTLNAEEYKSLCTLLLTFVGFINLIWICIPVNWLRAGTLAISAILIVGTLCGLSGFFEITQYTVPVMVTLITMILCTAMFLVGIYYLKNWYQSRRKKKTSNKQDISSKLWNKLSSKLSKTETMDIEGKNKKKVKKKKNKKKTEEVEVRVVEQQPTPEIEEKTTAVDDSKTKKTTRSKTQTNSTSTKKA